MRRVLLLAVLAVAIGHGLTFGLAGASRQACSVEGTGDFSVRGPGSGSIGLSDYNVTLATSDSKVVATCYGEVLDGATCGRLQGRTASAQGTDAEVRAVEGHPAESLISIAEDESFDLIAIGSVGMSGPKRFMLGNVPHRISHHAPTDILILHTS